ncbi:MAG: bifunctional tetrahydrofolate synthase/dihydrofolate synthase [Cytophagales bacterium]|nr:bifunctional tetrahydrofolate synthase/dihydrofolate synthase [Cytophagales bacterium]
MNQTPFEWKRIRDHYENKPISLGLERIAACYQRLDSPRPAPVVITVAGTNGKGSTCAMLSSILRQAGYQTGIYTSPHLVSFHERIRVNDTSVSDETLNQVFLAVEQADHDAVLTAFEVDTLAAFLAFKKANLDVAILEVGLGGRLDATNIISADCAIITSIDLDHTELLGHTREAIGFEKAGIMRAGKPVICSDPLPPHSIGQHAADCGADLWLVARDFHLGGDKQQWSWAASEARGRRQYHGLAYPALRGANQLINAAGVLAALDAIRPLLPVTAQAVRNGLAFVELPGRFQIIPGQPTLVLDVAHNPHSVAALTANLDAMSYHPRTHAIFGAMADKDLTAMLAKISPLIDSWYVCDLPTPRAATATALQAHIEAMLTMEKKRIHTPSISLHSTPQAGLSAAFLAADPTDRIVVFGSFFTVGGVLEHGLPSLAAPHLT